MSVVSAGLLFVFAAFLFKLLTGEKILWKKTLTNVVSEPVRKAAGKIAVREDGKIYLGENAIADVIESPVESVSHMTFPLLANVTSFAGDEIYLYKQFTLRYESCSKIIGTKIVSSNTGSRTLVNVHEGARFQRA